MNEINVEMVTNNDRTASLVRRMLASPNFVETMAICQVHPHLARDLDEFALFERHLAGRIFAELALQELKDYLGPRSLVLDEHEITYIAHMRQTGRRVRFEGSGLQIGLQGLTMPDAFVIKDCRKYWSVEVVAEYKSGARDTDLSQIDIFRVDNFVDRLFYIKNEDDRNEVGQLISSLRPELPIKPLHQSVKNLDVVYLLPLNSFDTEYQKIEVPITVTDLASLIDGVIEETYDPKVRDLVRMIAGKINSRLRF